MASELYLPVLQNQRMQKSLSAELSVKVLELWILFIFMIPVAYVILSLPILLTYKKGAGNKYEPLFFVFKFLIYFRMYSSTVLAKAKF